MPAGAEADLLGRVVRIGLAFEILLCQAGWIDQQFFGRGFTCERRNRHFCVALMVSGKLAVLGDRQVAREPAGAGDMKDCLGDLPVMTRVRFAQRLIGVQL